MNLESPLRYISGETYCKVKYAFAHIFLNQHTVIQMDGKLWRSCRNG